MESLVPYAWESPTWDRISLTTYLLSNILGHDIIVAIESKNKTRVEGEEYPIANMIGGGISVGTKETQASLQAIFGLNHREKENEKGIPDLRGRVSQWTGMRKRKMIIPGVFGELPLAAWYRELYEEFVVENNILSEEDVQNLTVSTIDPHSNWRIYHRDVAAENSYYTHYLFKLTWTKETLKKALKSWRVYIVWYDDFCEGEKKGSEVLAKDIQWRQVVLWRNTLACTRYATSKGIAYVHSEEIRKLLGKCH